MTQIYGSDSDTAAKLRSGVGGRLKGNAAKGEDAALMPFAEARECHGGPEGGEGVSASTCIFPELWVGRSF